MRILLAFTVLIALGGCRLNTHEMVLKSDYEQLAAWSAGNNLEFGRAHDGYYYSPTGPGREYSVTFCRTVIGLGPEWMRSADVTTWIRPHDANAWAYLVLSVDRNGKQVYYFSKETRTEMRKPGEWSDISLHADLPDMRLDDVIKVYVWNVSGKQVDVDEVGIRFGY